MTVRAAIKAGFARTWLERKKALQIDARRLARALPERLYYDLTVFNLPQLLRYEDRNSMAFSIESRVPFLDYRLVEFVFSLLRSMKIRQGWTKWVLRQATVDILPEEVRWRRDKKGFLTPETRWLQQSQDKIRELFTGTEVMSGELINPRAFLRNLGKMLTTSNITTDFWRIVNLEIWLRTFWGEERYS